MEAPCDHADAENERTVCTELSQETLYVDEDTTPGRAITYVLSAVDAT